ncbi:MAG: SurA N-terminal domain-containing protein [Bacteroidales bacterium]|nr:SurA N-terminal domain-containing protein [Bacteroidales bacterium]
MAVLQKIRNRGVLLVSAIAIALFLFVIGDLLRGGEGLMNQAKQTVGEVGGTSVSIQDYQSLFEEFQIWQEIAQQKTSSSEDDNNQLKDMAWQTYVQNKLIEAECEKLGLTVTDAEVADMIRLGASPLLQVPVFANQQTGRFDYAQLNMFLTEYQKLKDGGQQVPETYEKIYKYYMFAQKQMRSQALAGKYQALLSGCILSNPVEAKMAFDARSEESDILLVSLPLSAVADDKVSVSDDEVKAKYNADKEKYRQYVETRDAKMIDVAVTASEADRKALEEDMQEIYKALAAATDATEAGNVVRQNASLYPYSDTQKEKDAFPQMIASHLDGDSTAVAVGQTTKPTYDAMTNTYCTFKVLAKVTEPDSVLFRQLAVVANDEKEADSKADSIFSALSTGTDFKAMAKKYNQQGDSTWITSAQYQNAALDADNAAFVNALYSMNRGEVRKLKFSNGNTVILKVEDQRHPVTKYNVAAIIKELRFSDDTYSSEYNKFSSFIAANPTLEQMEANAEKNGYAVRPISDLNSAQHNISGIHNTRDAVKWLFDDAKVNGISQLYECGDNDHLLVVALTGINPEGYTSETKVAESIKQELINEKKIEKLIADNKSVKSIDAAKQIEGAVADTVRHITFAAPTFVSATMSSEPAISSTVSKTAKGQFAGPVKGTNGVYMFQVLDKKQTEEKYDEKGEVAQAANSNFRYVSQSLLNDLYMKANVKDLRYKFF